MFLLAIAALGACAPKAFGNLPIVAGDAGSDAALDPSDTPSADVTADGVPNDGSDALVGDVSADLASADGTPTDSATPDGPAADGPAGCRSDRECSASSQVCDTAAMLCVDCLRDVDCPGMGVSCLGHRCVTPTHCTTSRMCPGQVCDTGRGVCVDCTMNTDCATDQVCTDNACVASLCTPGAATCADETTRRVCSADGRSVTASPCPVLPNSAAHCAGGSCSVSCNAGFADCNMVATDGCEIGTATSGTNCGRCGTTCGDGQSCIDGHCVMTGCATGRAMCGGVCVDLNNDLANCGACGRTCTLPSATSSCARGACVVASCTTGFGDCDGVQSNGCEVNALTSTSNCGACGHACLTGQRCDAGACVSTCGAGLTLCGAGCVNLSSDSNNCGICGRSCMSAQVCAGGSCVVSTCPAGQMLCSGACRLYLVDPANCGTCGHACATGQTCAAGLCSTAPAPLRFSLSWSPTADLDISVVTPTGNVINYMRLSADGGALDADSMTTGPENITWAGTPPSGVYSVCAIPYRLTTSTTATLTIYNRGVNAGTFTRTHTTAAAGGTLCTRTSPYLVTSYTIP